MRHVNRILGVLAAVMLAAPVWADPSSLRVTATQEVQPAIEPSGESYEPIPSPANPHTPLVSDSPYHHTYRPHVCRYAGYAHQHHYYYSGYYHDGYDGYYRGYYSPYFSYSGPFRGVEVYPGGVYLGGWLWGLSIGW